MNLFSKILNIFKSDKSEEKANNRLHSKRKKAPKEKNKKAGIWDKFADLFKKFSKTVQKASPIQKVTRHQRRLAEYKAQHTTWRLMGEARRAENRRLQLVERKEKRCRKIAEHSQKLNRAWAAR